MQLNMRDWRIPALVGAGVGFAMLSGGRLPFFLLYLTAGLFLAAYTWMRVAARRLECKLVIENNRVEVGQELRIKLRLDNETVLPIPWVEVDDATPAHLVSKEMAHHATTLPVLGSRVIQLKHYVKRRGHYAIGPIRVSLGDPLGLFEVQREFLSEKTVTVYPRVHHIEDFPIPLSQPFGPVRTRERAFEDPSNQAEIRKYVPGDNPRYIHWKTSARMGELMLREYELNATTQMILFPDLSAMYQVSTGEGSTEEMIVELAASLAGLGLRSKVEVGLVCHAQERFATVAGRGQRTFTEILEVLVRVEASGALPIEQVLEREAAQLSGKSTLVVITPHLSARLADVLIRLRSNHQVMLVLLRAETFAGGHSAMLEETAASSQAALSLTGLLTVKRIGVYLVGANDDVRRLADLRLTAASEGVRAWTSSAHLSSIR